MKKHACLAIELNYDGLFSAIPSVIVWSKLLSFQNGDLFKLIDFLVISNLF
jgi:hypothetical protein